jgi:hypothetical protein
LFVAVFVRRVPSLDQRVPDELPPENESREASIRIPGAAQHAVVRRRLGILRNSDAAYTAIPDLRSSAPRRIASGKSGKISAYPMNSSMTRMPASTGVTMPPKHTTLQG